MYQYEAEKIIGSADIDTHTPDLDRLIKTIQEEFQKHADCQASDSKDACLDEVSDKWDALEEKVKKDAADIKNHFGENLKTLFNDLKTAFIKNNILASAVKGDIRDQNKDVIIRLDRDMVSACANPIASYQVTVTDEVRSNLKFPMLQVHGFDTFINSVEKNSLTFDKIIFDDDDKWHAPASCCQVVAETAQWSADKQIDAVKDWMCKNSKSKTIQTLKEQREARMKECHRKAEECNNSCGNNFGWRACRFFKCTVWTEGGCDIKNLWDHKWEDIKEGGAWLECGVGIALKDFWDRREDIADFLDHVVGDKQSDKAIQIDTKSKEVLDKVEKWLKNPAKEFESLFNCTATSPLRA